MDANRTRKQPVDLAQRTLWLARCEKYQGFRQPCHQQRKGHERGDPTVEKHRTPSHGRDDLRCDQSSHRGAQGVSGGLQTDRQSPPFLAGVLAGNDITAGQHSTDAQACQQPQCGKHFRGRRLRRRHHPYARYGYADQDQRSSTQAVRPGRDEQRPNRHAYEAGAEEVTESYTRQRPLAGHRRRRERHDQYIETVQHVDQKTQADHPPLESNHRLFIHQLSDRLIHGTGLPGHSSDEQPNAGQPKPARNCGCVTGA